MSFKQLPNLSKGEEFNLLQLLDKCKRNNIINIYYFIC